MEYRKTTLKVSVHSNKQNAIYGDGITHVAIDDEAAGGFIVLSQHDDDAEPGQVRLNMEELELICDVAKEMLAAYEQNGG